MAKASDIAKEQIFNKLKEVYPNGAIIDKKYYINLKVEGEEVQISVALTAPKTKVSFEGGAEPTTAKSETTYDEATIKTEAAAVFDFFNL